MCDLKERQSPTDTLNQNKLNTKLNQIKQRQEQRVCDLKEIHRQTDLMRIRKAKLLSQQSRKVSFDTVLGLF